MILTPLPMGRFRDECSELLGYDDPAERLAVIGDRGYDPDGPAGPLTTADDLLPDGLRDDVIERWIGDDGFTLADCLKPAWLEHIDSMRALFSRYLGPAPDRARLGGLAELVLDFEKLRLDPDRVGDTDWTVTGLGAALNMIYQGLESLARAHGRRLVLSGLTGGERQTPGRLLDRVRVALRVLGLDRDADLDRTRPVPVAGLMTYRYHHREDSARQTLHDTIYALWAHRRALDDSGAAAALWFGVSPFYAHSGLEPVPDHRLSMQLRAVNDFDPDRVVVWLDATKRDHLPALAKHFDRLYSLAP
ncbi:MAG: hypothetical protein H6826_14450 [Planctomycetes bacterium]|nr:hypothetical protein [Planctomycetota bacterium]